jgi:hypothetical protein
LKAGFEAAGTTRIYKITEKDFILKAFFELKTLRSCD